MDEHTAKGVTDKASGWPPKKYISVCLIVLGHLIFFIYFREVFLDFVKNPAERGGKLPFSISMATVAGILAGTYFYAYRFFKENFYFYVFIGWVANAIYLIPDLNGPSHRDFGLIFRYWIGAVALDLNGPLPADNSGLYFRYRVGILLLSLISTGFLLRATTEPGERKEWRRPWGRVVLLATLLALAVALIYFWLGEWKFGALAADNKKRLAWYNLAASVISFVIIWRLGDSLRARLGDGNYGRKVRWVARMFYVYALVQFPYPVFLYAIEANQQLFPYLLLTNEHLLQMVFLTAQAAKVINAVMMMGVLQAAHDKQLEAANAALGETEEKLKRRTHLAELGALTASIKHDIATPLATMGGHIQKIKERFQHNKEIVSKMEKLERSMDRIAATVDVVDVVRGENFYNRDKIMDKASMLEIAHRAIRSVKDEKPPMLSLTTVKVEGREVFVRAFVPMLEQVVVNLIKNALEAIAESGREHGLICVRVNSTHIPESNYSRWVKVEVEDNGCGIPQENVGKLTTLFTTRSDKKPNSGIGLFMGKKIMGIHGGRISFQSVVGEGTTVTLLLPEWNALQKAAHETHTTGTSPEGAPAPPEAGAPGEGAEKTYKKAADVPQHSGGAV